MRRCPLTPLPPLGSGHAGLRCAVQQAGHRPVACACCSRAAPCSGLLWACPPHGSPHACPPPPADNVAKLIILNTPLSLKTPLRPELAAYKAPLPFMRPKAGARFAGDLFNATGGPYAMARRDADAYDGAPRGRLARAARRRLLGGGRPSLCGAASRTHPRLQLCALRAEPARRPSRRPPPTRPTPGPLCAAPYESDPAASAAIAAIMERLDWPALLRRVDEGYQAWRVPSLLLFGTSGEPEASRQEPRVAGLRAEETGDAVRNGSLRRALEPPCGPPFPASSHPQTSSSS